jgi:hypothetical protein
MKEGTVSVILGCHNFTHIINVVRAWRRLYREWPKPWELGCIVLHDIGHVGKDYLTDFEQKKDHWRVGAELAGLLFGWRGFHLCAGHCSYSGMPRSRLYKADKMSWYLTPEWLTKWHHIVEPGLRRSDETITEATRRFHDAVKRSVESGEYRDTHDIYLEGKALKCETNTTEVMDLASRSYDARLR